MRKLKIFGWIVLLILSGRALAEAAEEGVLWGFEEVEVGELREWKTPQGSWSAEAGHAEVNGQFAHSGVRCLHVLGGEERAVILSFAEGERWETLSFRAERWTAKGPFDCRVEGKVNGLWSEIFMGDNQVKVGARFLSQVEIVLPDGCTAVRWRCTTPDKSGLLVDDVRLMPVRPMRVAFAAGTQLHPILIGREVNPLLTLNISVKGTLEPKSLKAVKISLAGSKNPEAIASVALLLDGEPFGKTLTAAEELVFQDEKTLSPGNYEMQVVCKLKEGATLDGRLRAECLAIKLDGDVRTFADSLRGPEQRIGIALRQSGQDDCHTYRIPGLATTNKGTLIAVYDNRYRNGGDLPGDMDVGMSRSTDGGQSWEAMKVIADMGNDPKWSYDGIGDPCVLVDRKTGTIWVAALWSHGNRGWHGSGPGLTPEETGQVVLVKSEDDGVTWSAPINITPQIKDPSWRLLLQGPGKGISLRDGTLVFPAQFRDGAGVPHSTLFFSQDHGKSWQMGTGAKSKTTEAQVVELGDGTLMLNCRDDRGGSRSILTTRDLGSTWQEHPTSRKALPEPVCMASLIRLDTERWGPILLFSNPNQTRGRQRMTVKVSKDEGLTWPEKWHTLLDEDLSMYSCLTPIDKDHVGLIYEGREGLYFLRLRLDELLRTS